MFLILKARNTGTFIINGRIELVPKNLLTRKNDALNPRHDDFCTNKAL